MHASNHESVDGASEPEGYRLLDRGDGRKLERFGPVVTDRPAPQVAGEGPGGSVDWRTADARYDPASGGEGRWNWNAPSRASWRVDMDGLEMVLRASPRGQVGVFPEQRENWAWVRARCRGGGAPLSILNLFAYTGAMTLHAAASGARLCHVDGSRGNVAWARENASINGLEDAPIRWITDDVTGFVRRESRRGRTYDGIVLDPPSFGRGPGGEVFEIRKHLPALVEDCFRLLSEGPSFVLLSAHSPGWGAGELQSLLENQVHECGGGVQARDMFIRNGGVVLPAGACARWTP